MELNQPSEIPEGAQSRNTTAWIPPACSSHPQYLKLLGLTILAGTFVNLCLGTVFGGLRFPLTMDTLGTILVSLLLGTRAGIGTGLLNALIRVPAVTHMFVVAPDYEQVLDLSRGIVIAFCVGMLAKRGQFRSLRHTIQSAVWIGVLVLPTHTGWAQSILFDRPHVYSFIMDAVDKAFQVVIALFLFARLPPEFLAKYGSTSEPLTPKDKISRKLMAARVGMFFGVLGVIFSSGLQCACPGYWVLTGIAFIPPILYGTRLIRGFAIGLLLCVVVALLE